MYVGIPTIIRTHNLNSRLKSQAIFSLYNTKYASAAAAACACACVRKVVCITSTLFALAYAHSFHGSLSLSPPFSLALDLKLYFRIDAFNLAFIMSFFVLRFVAAFTEIKSRCANQLASIFQSFSYSQQSLLCRSLPLDRYLRTSHF